MPGKVTTKQLALSILKARREEMKWLLANASGGGNWRRIANMRIEDLTKQIQEIENPITIKES